MTVKKSDGRKTHPPTEQQSAFAREYMTNGGKAVEAYKLTYGDKEGWSAEVMSTAAYKIKVSSGVQREIKRLRSIADQKCMVSLEQLTKELDENRELAKGLGKPEAMNAATMGKAKLHGLVTDKRETKLGLAGEFMNQMLDNLPDTTGLPNDHAVIEDDSSVH